MSRVRRLPLPDLAQVAGFIGQGHVSQAILHMFLAAGPTAVPSWSVYRAYLLKTQPEACCPDHMLLTALAKGCRCQLKMRHSS